MNGLLAALAIDGVSAIAALVIASFAIDRIATGLLFLLSFSRRWSRGFPDPASAAEPDARRRAEKKQKLLYYVLAAILGGVVMAYCANVRVFAALGFPTNALLDSVITGLVLMGGADRVASFMKLPGSPASAKPPPTPIEVTGRITIDAPGPGNK